MRRKRRDQHETEVEQDASSPPVKLGELELLVLLSLLRQRDSPYANQVRRDLEINAGRAVSRGALYRTLERLRLKELVVWELEPSALPERGGHPMRRLELTELGVLTVRRSSAVLLTFLRDLEPLLDAAEASR